MALSYNEYTANGTDVSFVSKPYLKEEHLVVTVGTEVQPSSAYTVTRTNVTFNTAPPVGSRVRIARKTSQDTRLTNYEDAALLTADAMDDDANQMFYVAQEALDTASETNLAGATFYHSSGETPREDTGNIWFDVSSTVPYERGIKVYNGEEWQALAPAHHQVKYKTVGSDGIEQLDIINQAVYVAETTQSFIFSGINTTLHSKATQIYLNGVRLVEGSSLISLVTGSADYCYSSGVIYFNNISASDVLVVDFYSGSFSETVTQKEASAQLAKEQAEAARDLAEQYKNDTDAKKSDTLQFKLDTHQLKLETAQLKTDTDTLRFHTSVLKSAAQNYAEDADKIANNPVNTSYTLSDGTTGHSAWHYMSQTQTLKHDVITLRGETEDFKDDASTYKNTASTKATQAINSADDSTKYALHPHGQVFTVSSTNGGATSQRSALAMKTDAQQYADTAHGVSFTDTYGTSGKYSALHYATAANLSAQSLVQFGMPFTAVSGYFNDSSIDLGSLNSAVSSLHGEEGITAQSDLAKDTGNYDFTSL